MAVDKYKMPASMLALAVDPEQVGFEGCYGERQSLRRIITEGGMIS